MLRQPRCYASGYFTRLSDADADYYAADGCDDIIMSFLRAAPLLATLFFSPRAC